jgi:putative aldouronate transport system permease protein
MNVTEPRLRVTTARAPGRVARRSRTLRLHAIRQSWQLYVLLILPMVYLIVFKYYPMYGAQIAFRNFNPVDGISGSPWVGLQNFVRFVTSYNFGPVMRNTIELSLYSLAAAFPFPILLAISLNYAGKRWFRKTVQMVVYAPYFISTVVMVGIILTLLNPRGGLINVLLGTVHLGPVDFMGNASYFAHIFVWSGVWQTVGFSCIVYLAALTSIDPTLHEAAIVDGASKWRRIWHIDLPGIAPIMVILLILDMGSILTIGYQKVLLLQNPINQSVSEVLDLYVYHVGLAASLPQVSYASAIGLFKSVVALILIVVVNAFARRVSSSSLW